MAIFTSKFRKQLLEKIPTDVLISSNHLVSCIQSEHSYFIFTLIGETVTYEPADLIYDLFLNLFIHFLWLHGFIITSSWVIWLCSFITTTMSYILSGYCCYIQCLFCSCLMKSKLIKSNAWYKTVLNPFDWIIICWDWIYKKLETDGIDQGERLPLRDLPNAARRRKLERRSTWVCKIHYSTQ